jgi:hypothetical protein
MEPMSLANLVNKEWEYPFDAVPVRRPAFPFYLSAIAPLQRVPSRALLALRLAPSFNPTAPA